MAKKRRRKRQTLLLCNKYFLYSTKESYFGPKGQIYYYFFRLKNILLLVKKIEICEFFLIIHSIIIKQSTIYKNKIAQIIYSVAFYRIEEIIKIDAL